jgi:transposase
MRRLRFSTQPETGPTYADLVGLVELLRAELVAARARIVELEGRIVELEARLSRNSQNSSKPPSSDMPGTRPAGGKRGRRRRRKRGGQPGHPARFSPVPDHVDHVHEYRPSTCEHCLADLSGGTPTGSVVNHYVYELPEIRPIVHDHQCLDVQCSRCGLVTRASLPPGVPSGEYDPSVQAMTGLLRGELRQSVRQTSTVMTQVLHVPMSPGMVAKAQAQVSQALAAPYEEALRHVQKQDRMHADETGWRQDKKKAWLWAAVSGCVTVFMVHASRGALAARALVGAAFKGILSTDRWASYGWVPSARRQLCWSHLKRDFKSFLDYGGEARHVGEQLLSETRRMFRLWYRIRDGTLGRRRFRQSMRPVRRRILTLLAEGRSLPCAPVSGKCREILRLSEALFTFVDEKRVEPTNNAAERALRFAVLWRKGSFGSDSAGGSRFVERFLTVRATLRSQKRDLYAYLKSACAAVLHCTPAPSLLLPAQATQAILAAAA